jgi:hypothetical protein
MTTATTATAAVSPLSAALTALQSAATIVSAIETLNAQHKAAIDTAVAAIHAHQAQTDKQGPAVEGPLPPK